ncbi:hypothetical protein ACFSKL_20705 [Belliella marina]|uniref:Uncharacterized protein n=1 Tax=Belliella marina TaxID=1644146 RepID=A0ABW4VTZ4_9BACT
MKNPTSYLFYAIIFIVVFLIVWIGKESFTQPGVNDLDLEFEEMAFYRNENNTGPVIRVYAVYAADTSWAVLKEYGELMPHTKYGNTKVYFFDSKENSPKRTFPEEPYFEGEYQQYCIAKYEKSSMGDVTFVKYPFRDSERNSN